MNGIFNTKLESLSLLTDSVKGIEIAERRILGKTEIPLSFLQEDKSKIKAAIFYSIASTQKGLQVMKSEPKNQTDNKD